MPWRTTHRSLQHPPLRLVGQTLSYAPPWYHSRFTNRPPFVATVVSGLGRFVPRNITAWQGEPTGGAFFVTLSGCIRRPPWAETGYPPWHPRPKVVESP
jgi:hypothetical protein